MSEIFFHRYELTAGTALNAATARKTYDGALVMIDGGVGCIHPWPEFGDAPLQLHLSSLLTDQPTALAANAIDCAREDAAARRRGVSLFDGVTIPRSHYSWSNTRCVESQCELLCAQHWQAVKLKGTSDVLTTASLINTITSRIRSAGHHVSIRVDFNSCLALGSVEDFLSQLSDAARDELDFLEDPVPYEASVWCHLQKKHGVRLAVDKAWANATAGFDYIVVKPARRDWRLVAEKHPRCPLIFTSAMDHPIGQSWAALQAARAYTLLPDRIGLGGLCTQHLFSGDPFCARLQTPGGHFSPDRNGGGLGFGDLLNQLKWEKLSLKNVNL